MKEDHNKYYHTIESAKIASEREQEKKSKSMKQNQAEDRLQKVMRTVQSIKSEEVIDEEIKTAQVRKYICSKLTPIISEGLLRIVETKPQNPVDYLVDYNSLRRSTYMREALNFKLDFPMLINLHYFLIKIDKYVVGGLR